MTNKRTTEPIDAELRRGVEAYAMARYGPDTKVSLEPAGRLEGGYNSGGLELFQVVATRANGSNRTSRVVLKRTSEKEVLAMRALRHVDVPRDAIAELIADGVDDRGPWLLMPMYEGASPQREAIAGVVFETLARVHTHYLERGEQLEGIVRVDAQWCAAMCVRMCEGIAARHRSRPHPVYEHAIGELEATAEDERISAALSVLPSTLVHGDMHGANIIVGPAGSTIIDWGAAGRGPGMLDVANSSELGSAHYQRYLAATGADPEDPHTRRLAEIGYQWATVQINTQYLGFALVVLGHQELDRMIRKRTHGLRRLGELLDTSSGV